MAVIPRCEQPERTRRTRPRDDAPIPAPHNLETAMPWRTAGEGHRAGQLLTEGGNDGLVVARPSTTYVPIRELNVLTWRIKISYSPGLMLGSTIVAIRTGMCHISPAGRVRAIAP